MNVTKKALFTSVMSLLLCTAMLLGTTFAWFTDSAGSSGNVIQSGNLNAEMYWSDSLAPAGWQNAEGATIFSHDRWEPGYTEIKYIKVKNEGNLALKWRVSIEAVGEVGDLAEVIDVYYVNPVTAELTSLNENDRVGLLSSVLNVRSATSGVLLPAGKTSTEHAVGEVIIAIAFHMDGKSVGNEYMGDSIGDGFTVKLIATQFTYEGDSFGNDYDADAQWPNNVVLNDSSATAPVTTTNENKVAAAVQMQSGNEKVAATVPAGVAVKPGATALTLIVNEVAPENSKANVTMSDTEAGFSLDVHMDGVAEDNEVPMAITITELLPVGLNMGNHRLVHVEDGVSVEMTPLADGEAPRHNTYSYNTATGEVVLYLKSFSEVKVISDTENAWNGTVATAFAGGDGSAENPYLIANADQLVYFGDLISNDSENYGDKYYKLIANINLGGEENANKGILFYPIGYHKVGGTVAALADTDAPELFPIDDTQKPENDGGYVRPVRPTTVADDITWYTYGGSFRGTFDGNGNKISNIYQNTWQLKGNYAGHYWNAAMGLFGYVHGGTIKNLTVDNFSSDGEFTPTGVIAAYAANATFENIAITSCNPRVYNTGNGGIVGIGGNTSDPDDYKLTFTNVTVDNTNKISALWGSWDVACGGLVGMFRGAGHVYMTNCHVAAQIDVYNDVCGNYQYYWYRYSGMMIGTNKNMTTDANGYTVPETDKFHAEDCTVHFGQWNDYYYCELVANSLASYTHDHQFSRLTVISSLDEIKSGDAWTKAGNFLLISGDTKTCYHIVNKDGTFTQHHHEDAGTEVVGGETVLKENNQIIYLPFNQLFTGYGWGVKHIPVKNGESYAFDGITILDRAEANSLDKFTVIINGTTYEAGTTLKIGDIFQALGGVSINPTTLKVFVSPVGEGSTASAIYTPNTSDWTQGTLTFAGVGAAKITITDYTYCKEAVTSVTVTEPKNADKFVAKENLSFTHTLQGGTIYKTLGDIFTATGNKEIVKDGILITVECSDGVECILVQNVEDWTASTLAFTGAGAVTLTITDGFYCNVATATVAVNHPANTDKFTANNGLEYTPKHDKETYSFTFGQLFTANVQEFVTDVVVTVGDEEYTFTKGEGWADKSITLTEFGTVTVTITDNNYCNVVSNTVTFNEPETVAKFEYIGENIYYGGQAVTMGDLFAQIEGTELGNDVVVTVNWETVYTGAEWKSHTLTFDKEGEFVIIIKEDSAYCTPTTVTVVIGKTDKLENKFTGDFLYRVGNENTVTLGTLFAEKSGIVVPVSGAVAEFEKVQGDAFGTYTSNADWTKGTIQFSGTGVVKVTVTADFANPVVLTLEVVDATNLTTATGTIDGGNFVLLNDVNTSTYVNYWNCTLYGNGFTYSLKGAPTAYNSKQGHGVIITKNAVLDNLKIVGDVYNSYGAYTNQDYYNTAIDVVGDTTIQNCYIANCAAPVKARSNVTIKNTTLYGGAVANLIIMSGTATLENVTTANYDDGRAVVGMGIVIHSDATESAKLVLNGTLTQYNFISESKVPTDTYAKNLHDAMFNSNCGQYQFGTSPNRYVNTGIISLTSTFNGEDITDKVKTGYVGQSLSVSSYNGYVYTQPNTNGSVNNNCPEYKPTTQGAVPPSYSFDYTNKNYVAKTDGSNNYCYEENGKVNISMDEGDTFNWDTSILTIGKGITNYTVSMNGTDYTGRSIAFNTAGDYTVTYTYTDANNYKLDENGNITTYSVTYTVSVNITVAVVKATTKHAEFTFGSSNTASTTVTVGNNTYVMPNVSGTSSTIGSTTVDGQTIYYPIVEIVMSDGKTSHTSGWYAYFPVFSGAVTITDYANNGTGDKMTPYNGSTTTMPSGLSVVGDPTQLFKYQSSSAAGSTPVVKNNKLVYSSASISAKRSEYNTVIQYSYTDNAGATYYYYIGYHAPAQSYSSCVTPDTLVTLADGTQKRIDALKSTDMVKVWNFYTGEYDVAPASIIMNHGEATVNVTTLYFADGTSIHTINGHAFFDVATNTFVLLDEYNAADYVGHSFVKQNGDGYATTELVAYSVEERTTEVWSVLTAGHYNAILEGMWSLTAAEVENSPAWLMPYEIGEGMKYDEAMMQADIEAYGLYTYADFADLCTYEEFVAFGFANFKVSVAKGYITWDEILYLISIHIQ